MSENQFIQIDAPHLSIREGESDELLNDGMFGQALAEYLRQQLLQRGYQVSPVVPEDWGWYVGAIEDEFQMDVCVYGYPKPTDSASSCDGEFPPGTPLDLCAHVGTRPRRYWSWKRFGFVDRIAQVQRLHKSLVDLFESDPEIKVIGCFDDFPLG